MKFIVHYSGTVKEFRLWLKKQKPPNVISISRYRQKKKERQAT